MTDKKQKPVNTITKEFISKTTSTVKSPLSPLCQRGGYCIPLAKGGEEGFFK
jgi:hypothetical protein